MHVLYAMLLGDQLQVDEITENTREHCTKIRTHKRSSRKMASGETRLKSYKTKGLDVTEVRRRREEEGVQLRRSRREEQVLHSPYFLHTSTCAYTVYNPCTTCTAFNVCMSF